MQQVVHFVKGLLAWVGSIVIFFFIIHIICSDKKRSTPTVDIDITSIEQRVSVLEKRQEMLKNYVVKKHHKARRNISSSNYENKTKRKRATVTKQIQIEL